MAQLQKGTTYITGDQVTAANLNALVDSGTLIAGAITDQTAKTVPLAADTILLHSAADTALRKTTMTQLFATPQPLGATTPSSVAATTGGFSGVLDVGAGGFTQGGYGLLNINGSSGGMVKFGTATVLKGSIYGNAGGITYETAGALNHSFYTNSVSRGTITDTGLNGMAIGATTPSTGAFTTLAASGTGAVVNLSGATTSSRYYKTGNNGQSSFFGAESSTGGSIISGSTAYATILANDANVPVQIGSNNAIVATFTSTGLNSTAIGATTVSTGAFSTLSATGLTTSTGGFTAGSSGQVPVNGSGSSLQVGYVNAAITSTVDAFVAWAGSSAAFNPSGVNGSLLLAARNIAGAEVVLAVSGAVVGRFSSTGLAVTGTQTITSTSAIKLTLNGGTNQNGIQLETSTTTGTHAFYIASGNDLIVGGDRGFAIMDATSSYAGRFFIDAATGLTSIYAGLAVTGALSCTGALSKGSGSFRIEHPLPSKSATHQLVHSFIEGPKCDLIYRGKVDLVDGKAFVNIDADSTMTEGTFEALCATVQCFTSNESGWGAIRGKVVGNILTIEAQDAASTDNVSWMVIGERKDKHIMDTEWTDDNGRPIVEPLKPAEPALESK